MALGWTLNPMTGNLMKRGRTHRGPEEERVKIKADWGPPCQSPNNSHEALQTPGPGPLWFPLLLCVPFLTLLGPHCLPYSPSFLLSVASSSFHPFPASWVGFILCLYASPFWYPHGSLLYLFSALAQRSPSQLLELKSCPPYAHFLFLLLCFIPQLHSNHHLLS